MPSPHEATVRGFYEAFGRGDVASIIEALADDVEWEAGAVDHGVPWLTPGRGRDHVAGFFDSLSALEFKRFEPRLLLGDGDHVLALIAVELAVPATGRSIAEDGEAHLWTFGADGRVTSFRHYVDTLQHHRAWAG